MARVKNVRKRIKFTTVLVEGYRADNEIVTQWFDIYGEADFEEIRSHAYTVYEIFVGRIIESFVHEVIYQMPEATFFKLASPVVNNEDESEDE